MFLNLASINKLCVVCKTNCATRTLVLVHTSLSWFCMCYVLLTVIWIVLFNGLILDYLEFA